jgi:hypothetical protein
MSVLMDVRVEVWDLASAISGLGNRQLTAMVGDLDDEAKKRLRAELNGQPEFDVADAWDRIERALNQRDFDTLADVLWPEVKARWPRPKMTNAYAQEPAPAHDDAQEKA